MRQYTVRRGDCISSIAFEEGYFPDTLWGAPENAELVEKRGDPNVLVPGDIVVLPDKIPKSTMCMTGKRHRFVRRGVPEKLKVRLYMGDEPRTGEAYVLELDGKVVKSGEVGADGLVEASIPPNAHHGRILLRDGAEEIQLSLGTLPPIDTILGVQVRLQNLGYYTGRLDGDESDDLDQAVLDFQADRGLEPTAYLDEDTWEAIRKAYTG
jgi:hypothetical protein